jgi:catechol 2,3-dioxygenase-like lactoylglutathione lyase family enzyme
VLLRVHHVQLAMPPAGEETARRFYRDVLGLQEAPKPRHLRARGGCWFRGTAVELHLGVEEPFRPARKAHTAFIVADLDQARSRLEAAGHPIMEDTQLDGHRRFYTADPFGNRLEFIERTPG